jgi:hypothetical protein
MGITTLYSAQRSEIVSACQKPGTLTMPAHAYVQEPQFSGAFDTIRADAEAPILPLGFARRTRFTGGLSGISLGGAE